MTEIEQKSLKTQVNTMKEIQDCDRMILHYVRWKISNEVSKILKDSKEIGDGNIEISGESYLKLISIVNSLDVDRKNLNLIDKSIGGYLDKKELLSTFLNQLI